jgi:hypothetical protein
MRVLSEASAIAADWWQQPFCTYCERGLERQEVEVLRHVDRWGRVTMVTTRHNAQECGAPVRFGL